VCMMLVGGFSLLILVWFALPPCIMMYIFFWILFSKALELKSKGTEAYYARKFNIALDFYTNASQMDGENMVFVLNNAAVYLEMKNFDDCIKSCEEAVKIGRKHFADFKLVSKYIFLCMPHIYCFFYFIFFCCVFCFKLLLCPLECFGVV